MRSGQANTPSRYLSLVWIAGLFIAINTLVRLGLVAFEADWGNLAPWRLLPILGIGLLYDAAAVAYVLASSALVALLVPDGPRGRILHGVLLTGFVLVGLFAMLFTAAAEGLFWNEFSTRFNFIAVDYLVYTRETIGNIRQSYPVEVMLASVAALSLALFWLVRRQLWAAGTGPAGTFRQRLPRSAAWLLPAVLAFSLLGDAPREALPTAAARELAGNGYYEFVRAFRANDLDFDTFYMTLPETAARAEVRREFERAHTPAVFTGGAHPLERRIASEGEPKPLNVVLVTMESLGANFLDTLGGSKGLTPNLDRLARDGLSFTRAYATGTRTVRGLEALALSMPPTPGHAVLTRKNNKGFQTLGGVFKANGYTPLFIYGGYSYFDNMKDFFGGNGYEVVDRTAIPRSEISHETIWGVADEDLFRLVVREMDARTAAGTKVFAHVMTTSNHRPFTYPAGRIDIASGSGREGAVKYSDWAIGSLMREAERRPWFKDTLFVFVADHTSHARGRTDLPPENYHIPLIFYAPGLLAPRAVDSICSQIDVGPTILALLNFSYTSRFFGQDILSEGRHHQRALMSNYLTVGHLEDGVLVELSPKRRARVLEAGSERTIPPDDPRAAAAIQETVAIYQTAAGVLRHRR